MTEKLKIVYRPLKDLTPYASNARTHDDRQLLQLVASIEEFGWTNPILIDDNGEIIAGHGRVLAAEQMGVTSIPTITLSGLNDAQKTAYRIADNRLPLNAGWNGELLKVEIEALQGIDFDIGLLGFSDLEVGNILGVEPDDPTDHWVGMPAFDQGNTNGVRQLIVHFETDADVALFAQLVQQQITAKTKYIWYPEHKRESTVNKAYISDES